MIRYDWLLVISLFLLVLVSFVAKLWIVYSPSSVSSTNLLTFLTYKTKLKVLHLMPPLSDYPKLLSEYAGYFFLLKSFLEKHALQHFSIECRNVVKRVSPRHKQ